jgi:hypothetical protein
MQKFISYSIVLISAIVIIFAKILWLIKKHLSSIFLFVFLNLMYAGIAAQQHPKTPSVQEVYTYIVCSEIKFPDIVLRQAIWETGWFKSKHMIHKNNLFGFRHSKEYMNFKNWKECVDYYKNWQLRKYTREGEDYYAFLIRIKYAQSNKYIESLKSLNVKTAKVNCNEK